ncbi:SpvB/TcaC N-terminal domain-containing protein [Aliikangiella coralliicola]|uniref:Uncharacterized protein n=1 Tax=Aliikangiella coralliicola TaxID=2592383 RepID=A0A545UAA1_9GAMM|nr:SpvB/TcaC N-terminal domain-containing protein [Aliikangiella coralliicola]TQV86343.1 hypothetical protein FLL46_15580 [Aliikangiella coralliicola]
MGVRVAFRINKNWKIRTMGFIGKKYAKKIIASSIALVLGFSGAANATNEILGDFNGDGNQDAFVQAINPGEASKIEAKQGVPDLLYHRTWTKTHPDIPAIPDWSADSYTALSENLNSSPGDELLLLGHNKIILLHGRIITPILIPKDIRNAIVSWSSSGVATFSSFSLDVDPDNFNPQFADFDGDGDKEIFIQNKSKGGTSYIVTGEGVVSQTLVNGYLGTDWSAGSTIVLVDENGDGRVDMRITDGSGNVTVVYASGSGTFVTNPVAYQPGYAKKFSGTVDDVDLSAPTVPANEAVGAVEGQAGVSGGAATYSVPIAIPPGRNGMQPNVALSYSSRNGNGIAGIGWGLSAASSIRRCGQIVGLDDKSFGVTYTGEDRLCLDGQRLILTQGATYGANGTEYRTEQDSFARIILTGDYNATDSSGSHFTVEHKSGMVSYYGKTSNSRHTADGQSKTLSWALTSREDRTTQKNNIQYTYATFGGGEHLLTEINYTGSASTVGDRKVKLIYESRPDKSTNYLAGGKSAITQRLSKVETYYVSQKIRSYNLSYGSVSGATQRSLLRSLEECAFDSNGASSCLPATTFNWQDAPTQFTLERVQEKQSDWLNGYIRPVGDFDGDGFKESIVNQTKYELGVGYTNQPRLVSFNADGSVKWEVDLDKSWIGLSGMRTLERIADINNDGAAELIIKDPAVENYEAGSLTIYKVVVQSGNAQLVALYTTPFTATQAELADVDGDNKLDIVTVDFDWQGTTQYRVFSYHKNTSALPALSFQTAKTEIDRYQTISPWQPDNYQHNTRQVNLSSILDFNGDGIQDLQLSNNMCSSEPQPDDILLSHSTGYNSLSYTSMGIAAENHPSDTYHKWVDINGDGLSDYLFVPNRTSSLFHATAPSWHYQLNNGVGFEAVVSMNSMVGFLDESVCNTGTCAQRLEPAGCGTSYSDLYEPKFSHIINTADWDNDGQPELIVPSSEAPVARYCKVTKVFSGGGGDGTTPPEVHDVVYCANDAGGYDGELHAAGFWSSDQSVYKTVAYRFVQQANGDYSLVLDSNSEKYSSKLSNTSDLYGDGLNDPMVHIIGLTTGFLVWDDTAAEAKFNGHGTHVYRSKGATSNAAETMKSPDMMISSTNGLGVESKWRYAPLSSNGSRDALAPKLYEVKDVDDPSRYVDDKHFYFTSSMMVVDDFTQSDGVGGDNTTRYSYREAMYNNQGYGFQGFRTILVDGPDGIRSVSDFHQKFPLSGQIEAIRTCLIADSKPECADGFLSQSTTTYHQRNTANSRVHWIVPHVSTQTQYALNNRATELSTSTTTIEAADLDTYGNIKKTVSTVNNGFSTVKTTVLNNFDTSVAGWRNKLNWTSVQTETMSGSAIYDAALDPVKKVKTSYTWTSARLPDVVTVTPELGGGKTTEVDTDYNAYGLPTKVSTYESGSTDKRAVETKYSADGENLSTDGKGYFVYQVINDKDHVVTTKTYPTHGQVKSVTSNSLTTTTEYDAFGRVEKITPPADSGQPSYLRYATCNNGCDGLSDTNIRYKVTTYSAGAPESVEYKDQLNRVIYSKTEGFDGTAIFVKAQYDNLGRMTFESIPSGSASETLGTTYDSYDALGRLTKKSVSQPYNNKMEVIYAYSGHLTSISATDVINGVTNSMSRTYSGNGQLMQTSQYDGTQDIITQYAYDSSGNPIVLQDGNGNPIKAEYNALGQKKYVNDPNMGTKTFAYTGFGEVYSELDANGDTYYYAYDDLGRLQYRYLNVIPTPSNTSSAEASFSYDSQCEGLPDGETRLNLPAGESFSKSYGYDAWCRPFETITNIDGTAYKVSTQYDGNYGRVKAVTYPTGLTVENIYNERGYLTQAKNAASGYVYHQIDKMDARGQLLEAKKANGVLTEGFEYWDETGQMKEVYTNTTTGASQRHRIEYLYDGFGNLKTQTVENKRNGQTIISKETYTYDALHRLKVSSRDIGGVAENDITYDYDKVGNLTRKDDYATSYVYGTVAKSNGNAGPNAVYSVTKINSGGTKTFSYDNNGNLLSGDGKTIAYNAFNKPVSINRNGVTSLFSYGADQMRYKQVKKGISGGDEVTRYVDKVYEEITHNGKTEKKLYLGDAIVTETVNSSDTSYKVGFVHRDRLGSVVTITDETGEVVDNKSYDPFGKPRKGTLELVDPANPATLTQIASLDGFELQTDRGFTDHEHLDDAELIHMNGRVYDYNLGRFLSVDPFIVDPGHSQSINPYSYIRNNPLAGKDPSGYLEETAYGAGLGIASDYTEVHIEAEECIACTPGAVESGIEVGTAVKAVVATGTVVVIGKLIEKGVQKRRNRSSNTKVETDNAEGPMEDTGEPSTLGAKAERAVADARASGKGYGKRGAAGTIKVSEETASVTGEKYYSAGSKEAGKTIEVHPVVKDAYGNVPEDMRTGAHGNCAEAACLTKILNDVEKATGKKIKTKEQARAVLKGAKSDIRETSARKGVGKPKEACGSCKPPLEDFGVEDVNKKK